jgi:mannitol-1-phosphate/altronate dehydrogenase
MPDKLKRAGAGAGLGNGLEADNWKDIFVAWAPSKNVSFTLAYVDLGRIVPATTAARRQTGVYLSAQINF